MAALGWVAAALAWLPLLLAIFNVRRFAMPPLLAPAGMAVSVLIPARDEAAGIEVAVRAVLASRGVQLEVVVLDDDSSDETAAIVAELAATDDRVRLLCAPPLPPGWAGKQRACHLLSEAARFPVLVFVDADVHLAPEAVGRAAGLLLADARLGMVSGFPRQLTGSWAERLVVPWIHLLLLGYLPMARMRQSTSPSYAAACGQWVIARRDAYAAVRGHAAAPTSRHDGLSLPRTFRTAGWRTDVFDGHRLATCRMYRDFATVWHGFGKSAGEGLATPAALPVWTVLIAGGHVLPAVVLGAGIVSGSAAAVAAGLAGVVANLALRAVFCVRFGSSWTGALLHPFGAALVLAIQWTALVRHLLGRPSEWRGRAYLRA